MHLFSKAKLLFIIMLYFLPFTLLGADFSNNNPQGVGQVAVNMLQPVSLLSDFVHSACFIIGACFLFATVIKYFEHRRSPMMVPVSTIIFLLIAGIVLILLPFAAYITENGVQYTLLK